MKFTIFALLSIYIAVDGNPPKIKCVSFVALITRIENFQRKNFAGIMISVGNVLSVAHETHRIGSVEGPLGLVYEAYIALDIMPNQRSKPDEFQVIDIHVLDENVKKGEPNDIAILTFSDLGETHDFSPAPWQKLDINLSGKAIYGVYILTNKDPNSIPRARIHRKIFEILATKTCLELHNVTLSDSQFCALLPSTRTFSENEKGAGLIQGGRVIAIAIMKINAGLILFEKVGWHATFINSAMEAGSMKAGQMQEKYKKDNPKPEKKWFHMW